MCCICINGLGHYGIVGHIAGCTLLVVIGGYGHVKISVKDLLLVLAVEMYVILHELHIARGY